MISIKATLSRKMNSKKSPSPTESDDKLSGPINPGVLWKFNIFAVVPFAFFLLGALATNSFIFSILALTFAPVALVTIGLDIYAFVKRQKA